MKFLRVHIQFFILLILFLLCIPPEATSCTIFYLKSDSLVLAGNNEDWEDPDPVMWFIPGKDGKLGWVKFGWGSGFPQGGMNEKGLFWDATSGPYLAMPGAEANKVKVPGALMQRVIESCASVDEAMILFNAYYCEDQYKAQYLVGDAHARAIIVEGDSILPLSGNHMILTNFYHSHPELGGYPCDRYRTASEMIRAGNDFTPYLVGSILASTHQEGRYPTQYSQIYDLGNQIFYLFYHYNYEEYILIDLNKELNKGDRSFAIPGLFAGISMLTPDIGDSITGTGTEFSWSGKQGFQYELLISPDPDFPEHSTIQLVHRPSTGSRPEAMMLLLAGTVLFLWTGRRKLSLAKIAVLILVILPAQCSREDTPDTEETVEMTRMVTDLDPRTTYYWKIRACPVHSDAFRSETVIRSFRTGN